LGNKIVTEEFDDIILSELNDDELVEQMHEDLYDGLADEIAEGTQILLDRGWEATKVLDVALVEGMVVVGDDFRDGILFVPEVLLAANAMKAGMALLEPILSASGIEPIARMVIGTVKGDIHDIGKNLVGMMMEGAGVEVFNLGINTDVDEFINALEEHDATILGMSALLTTTMPYMKVVIDELKERGLRDKYIIMVGGAPLNDEFAEAIGADAYCMDAGSAVETMKKLVAAKN
jgi:5-methyltetrahydrofolate--homocysteine methyltransferase